MKHKILAVVCCLAVLTLFATQVGSTAAGFFEWSRLGRLVGPDVEPYISVIAPHPTDPDVLYAGTLLTIDGAALVYRSDDGGKSWVESAAGLPDNLPPFSGVKDLIALPDTPGALLAALDGAGVWFSLDGGASWESASGGSLGPTDTAVALAAAPSAVYALTSSGVHASLDGEPWQQLGGGLPDPGDTFYYDLAVQLSDPPVLYAATSPLGIFRSADGGATWAAANGDLPATARNARSISVSPTDGTVYAGVRGAGLFRSGDGGATWTLAHSGITYNTTLFGMVGAPVISPTHPDLMYAFNGDGIFRTENGGATWSPFATGLTGEETISALAFNPARAFTIYAGTSISGVWDLTLAPGGRYFVPVIRR